MPAADPRKDAPRVTTNPAARDPMPGEPGGPVVADAAGEYLRQDDGSLKRLDVPEAPAPVVTPPVEGEERPAEPAPEPAPAADTTEPAKE